MYKEGYVINSLHFSEFWFSYWHDYVTQHASPAAWMDSKHSSKSVSYLVFCFESLLIGNNKIPPHLQHLVSGFMSSDLTCAAPLWCCSVATVSEILQLK